MTETWYHVVSYAKEPYSCYGFAVNDQELVFKVAQPYTWMLGNKLDTILKFFQDKPALVSKAGTLNYN